jgi:hypothetical protein
VALGGGAGGRGRLEQHAATSAGSTPGPVSSTRAMIAAPPGATWR